MRSCDGNRDAGCDRGFFVGGGLVLSLALLSWLVTPGGTSAGTQDPDAGFLRLTHPGQPTGWDHGQSGVSGWQITKHGFEAGLQAAPLVSGWTFGEFELRLGWSVPSGGVRDSAGEPGQERRNPTKSGGKAASAEENQKRRRPDSNRGVVDLQSTALIHLATAPERLNWRHLTQNPPTGQAGTLGPVA